MEFLIGVAVVALVGLLVLPGLLALGLVGAESRGRRKAASNADAILDGLFATDEPTVTYDTRPYNHLNATDVIAGAKRRGWKLIHDNDGVLLLERDTLL